MTRRRLNKAIKRLKQLPGGKAFFQYSGNKFLHYWLKAIGSPRVAHPSTIMLELSAHCNIHCTICPREYDYGKVMDKGYMDLHQAKKVIDQSWPYLDSIGLTGMGETFLYPHLEEVVDYIRAKNKGIVISASINAYAPRTEEYATKLRGKIDTIQVSIDGVEEVYDQIRQGSDFRKFSANLSKVSGILKGSSTDLMLNMVVTKENYYQMGKVLAFANQLGIRFVNYTIFNLAAVTGIEKSYYGFYLSGEFIAARKDLDQTRKAYPEMETTFWEHNPEKGFRNCPFPWSHFYVCWNGEMAPCCAKPFPRELSFGNVFEKPLMEVLNCHKYINFRKMWQKNRTHPFCNKCHFIDLPALVPS